MAKKKRKPIKIITLDTETYNGLLGNLKKIAIYDGKQIYYGDTFNDIQLILANYHKAGFTVHVYIHNMEFDLRKIWDSIKHEVVWEKSLAINGKMATLYCEQYIFHDSFKLLPMALAKLSKDFEVEHGKLDLWEECKKRYPKQYKNLVDFLDRCPIDDPLFIEYLGYDVLSLYEVIEKLIDLTGIEPEDFVKRVSTASLSRFIFKNGHKGKIFKQNGNTLTDYDYLCLYKWQFDLETEDFIRQSYCGGRTEVFKIVLDHKGKHYDVNSEYPYVCHDKVFPIGKPTFTDKPKIVEYNWNKWLKYHEGLGFLNCTVYIPKQNIPPLPVKMGKLVFPCGVVCGVWTYTELEYAIKNCGVKILEYHAMCHFEKTYPIFKNFIKEFYQMKEQATIENNKSKRQFAKLIQNVAYGYTGMKREKSKLIPLEEIEKYNLEDINYIDDQLGFAEVTSNVDSEYIQVQVASYVTSYARLVLLDALRYCDARGNVYYCDTDSIVTDVPLPPEKIHKTKLGFWDLESEPDRGIFLMPKVYTEREANETNIKFKGISKETQKTLTFEYYDMILQELKDGIKDGRTVEKNKTLLRSILYMQKQNLPNNYYEVRDKKMNYRNAQKRQMFYDENRTEPLYFETIDDFMNFEFKKLPKRVQLNEQTGGIISAT